MIGIYIRCWNAIGIKRKGQILFLILLMLFALLFEIVSIGAVLPFLSLLSSPEKELTHPIFLKITKVIHIRNRPGFRGG